MITIPLYFGNFLTLLCSLALLLLLAYCLIEATKYIFIKVLALDTPHAPKFKFTNPLLSFYNTILKCNFLYIKKFGEKSYYVAKSKDVKGEFVIRRQDKSSKIIFDKSDRTWSNCEYNGSRFRTAHQAELYIADSMIGKTKQPNGDILHLMFSLCVYAFTLDLLLFMFQYASLSTMIFVGVVILCFSIRKVTTFMYKKFYNHDLRITTLEDGTTRDTGMQEEDS